MHLELLEHGVDQDTLKECVIHEDDPYKAAEGAHAIAVRLPLFYLLSFSCFSSISPMLAILLSVYASYCRC